MPEALINKLLSAHSAGLAKKSVLSDIQSTLPSDFYHSPAVYEFERRAIFGKVWTLLSHCARFRNSGDFVKFELAGYEIVVVRQRSKELVGFHNVCRHRAYPVVQKDSGTASVFTCKYHGWSYGLDGHLTKAPQFGPQTTPDFDKTKMGMFPVHVHVDRNGFVYVNLDAASPPDVTWNDQFGSMDLEPRFNQSAIDWDNVEYDHTWTEEGAYNWKLMQENYNECYHCLTTHPGIAKTTNLNTYYVDPAPDHAAYISHYFEPKIADLSKFDSARFNGRSTTYVFPIGHITPNPGTGLMYLMRCVPTGPRSTRQEYDVFRLNTPHSNEGNLKELLDFYRKVESEDIDLCKATQKNIERGIYQTGPLHPFKEEGVIAFKDMYKRYMLEHVQLEQNSGAMVDPALPYSAVQMSQDRGCSAITRHLCMDKSESLDW